MIRELIELKYQKYINKIKNNQWERLHYICECEHKSPKEIICTYYIYIEWKEINKSRPLLNEWHAFVKEGYLERRERRKFYLTKKGYDYICNN